MSRQLIRFEGPRFVAGLVYDGERDRVLEAAPILRRLVGRGLRDVKAFARSNGSRLDFMPDPACVTDLTHERKPT